MARSDSCTHRTQPTIATTKTDGISRPAQGRGLEVDLDRNCWNKDLFSKWNTFILVAEYNSVAFWHFRNNIRIVRI